MPSVKVQKDYVESNPRGFPLCVTINITMIWNTQRNSQRNTQRTKEFLKVFALEKGTFNNYTSFPLQGFI